MARIPKSQATPRFLEPLAAQVAKRLPEGAEWLYEVKFDGYRALLLKERTQVLVRSRNAKDLTRMYPSVASAALRVKAEQAVIDGEIVAIDERGRPSFQALQHRGAHPDHQIVYDAFDLLHLDGVDLTGTPLIERRAKLAPLLERSGLRLSVDLPGTPEEVLQAVQALGLEGVIAKRKASPYEAGERSADWLKVKLDKQQEFVVGGYRPSGPSSIDALLIGYYEGKALRFAGKVRAGFVPHVRREVFTKLQPLNTTTCFFSDLPSTKPSRWGEGITAEEMKVRGTRSCSWASIPRSELLPASPSDCAAVSTIENENS